MKSRMTLFIAAGLTAFVLVLVGAIASLVTQKDNTTLAQPMEQSVVAPAEADGTSSGLTAEQAAAIASSVAPDGATSTSTPELVNFQGTVAYEVVFGQGNVYVDAETGLVLYNGVTATQPAATSSAVNQAVQTSGYEGYDGYQGHTGHEHAERGSRFEAHEHD